MADLSGPGTYLEKLRFAQRLIRSAKFRNDQKQAVRELSEACYEVVVALLQREEGKEVLPGSAPPDNKPTP